MSYPTTPEFSAIKVESRHSNVRTETRSGRTQVRSLGAQRWSFTAKYNDLTRDEFAPVFAFVVGTGSGVDSFDIVPPVISDSKGNVSGTALTNGAHSIGDSTIAIDGISGTIKAGDFIKFAGHDKVYMVTADRTGAGIMSIHPPLISAVANDAQITYDNVPFKMRVANDIQQFGLTEFDRFTFEVDMIEVI